MDNVFDVVKDAIQDEKLSTEGRINTLSSFQANISRQAGIVKSLAGKLKNSVLKLLGQFSNKAGYSVAEITSAASVAVEASLSNAAGVAGIQSAPGLETVTPPEDKFASQVQESINRFHSALLADPGNAFVLPRVIYDNMVVQNVARANALNEAIDAVGLGKLMHDVIPGSYYASLSLQTLETAQPQLLEVVRNLTLACGAIGAGNDPAQLIETIENDFESAIRFIGREDVYDSSQFSPTEFLTVVNKIKAAADAVETTTSVLEESKTNILTYQTSFLSSFSNSFSECGTLSTAIQSIQGVSDRIDVLKNPELPNSEPLAIEATREIILVLVTALAMVKDFVRKEASVSDSLTVTVSPERTSFEASQAAIASVPTLSSTLPADLRRYARLLEQRLTVPAVSPQVAPLFASVTTEIPIEFVKSESLQVAFNSYDIDVTEESKSIVIRSLSDIKELGLNRMFKAILLGDLTVAFDTNATRASKVGFAIQEVALALEGAASGVSLALGGCKISNRMSARRLSTMMAELQDTLHVRVFAQLGFRESLNRRLRILKDKKLKRLCRQLEEVAGITLAERCE